MGKPRSRFMSNSRSVSPNGKPRNRSGDLGRAYDHLREILPTYQSDRKKLTKIETLKLATIYISDLAGLLEEVKTDPNTALSPDVRLNKRSRRNSSSSTEISRSESFQSLSSSSPSNDLFCPPSSHSMTERHPLCRGQSAHLMHTQTAPGLPCNSFIPQQMTTQSFNWPSDPWSVQNQPLSSSCRASDSLVMAGFQQQNSPQLNHTNDFKYCEWSAHRPQHTGMLYSHQAVMTEMKREKTVQPPMLWTSAY